MTQFVQQNTGVLLNTAILVIVGGFIGEFVTNPSTPETRWLNIGTGILISVVCGLFIAPLFPVEPNIFVFNPFSFGVGAGGAFIILMLAKLYSAHY